MFKFVVTEPRKMIKETGRTVRGRQLHSSIFSFVRNLNIACDKLTTGATMERDLKCWRNGRLLVMTAQTMFDAIFNTVFGRDESALFNSELAYHNFQACMYVCMYVYSHKQSPMYNVNTEQDKKCRTERSYKTLITAQKLKLH